MFIASEAQVLHGGRMAVGGRMEDGRAPGVGAGAASAGASFVSRTSVVRWSKGLDRREESSER